MLIICHSVSRSSRYPSVPRPPTLKWVALRHPLGAVCLVTMSISGDVILLMAVASLSVVTGYEELRPPPFHNSTKWSTTPLQGFTLKDQPLICRSVAVYYATYVSFTYLFYLLIYLLIYLLTPIQAASTSKIKCSKKLLISITFILLNIIIIICRFASFVLVRTNCFWDACPNEPVGFKSSERFGP